MRYDITLVHPSSPFLIDQAVFPPLGILYLSAFLKERGFTVQCIDLGCGSKKEDAESDVIGISFTSPQKEEAFKLVKYYNENGKVTIAGGAHPTHMSNECFKAGFNFVVQGAGENNLLLALYAIYEKKYPDSEDYFRQPSLEFLPFPDRKAVPIYKYEYEIDGASATTIMTSRGCPYFCKFCAKVTAGCEIESAEKVVSELLHINQQFGYEAFMIFDDIFIASKARVKEIADRLKQAGKRFKFRCFARTNLINEEICETMKDMGVVEVGLGVESGSDLILEKSIKGTTCAMNLKAVKMLKSFGIRVKTFIIVGLPGENKESVAETKAFLRLAKPDDVDVSIFQPMPGSDIFKNPNKYGISFNYESGVSCYKGKPEEYSTSVSTKELSSKELIAIRYNLELEFKRKGFNVEDKTEKKEEEKKEYLSDKKMPVGQQLKQTGRFDREYIPEEANQC